MSLAERKWLAITIIAVIIVAAVVGVGVWLLTRPAPGPVSPIKIGFHAPLTGFAAADGYSALHGALLAVRHINEAGGVLGRPLQLIYYDDKCNPDEAVAIAHKLIEEDRVVAAVSGSYSHPTLSASPIFDDAGVPYISAYAVHPDIVKDKPHVFRVGLNGQCEGKSMGYIAFDKLGARKVAILCMDIPFGITLADNAKAYIEGKGGEVVYYEKYELGETDFSAWLTEIKSLQDAGNLDALLVTAYYSEAAHICKQARDMGITVPIVGCEGFDSPKFLELAGDAAEGVIIVTDLNRDSESELVQRFLADYRAETGIPADMVGASAYDAVFVLAKAIEKAGSTDPAKICDALRSFRDVELVTGILKYFTEQGNACKTMVAQIVENGEFHFYAEITDPDLITPPE